jgi:hypothetical protein
MPHFFKCPVNPVSILCYEDGDPAAAAAAKAAADEAAAKAAAAATGNEDKKFTQADLNKILAEDKRKHQEKFNELVTSHQELLQNQNLTTEERDSLATRLEDLQASHRTKEQQTEHDRKLAETKSSTELETERKRADHWESMFKTNEVQRALQDAAVGADAFNPGHIVALLAPDTQLKDVDGRLIPMVDFQDIDEKDGSEVRTLRTPADAVKRMQELPKVHGNLFRSNVVSGVGSGQATPGDGDNFDYANMSPEEYRKNRKAILARVGQSR